MAHQTIETQAAPAAIGAYSQAVRSGDTVYLSGQIPLDPATQSLVEGSAHSQIRRVFENLSAVAQAAGAGLDDIVKLTVYLTDMADYPAVNEVMDEYFSEPYPARAAVAVAGLPKGARIEADAILVRPFS
ncbi:MAG: RidA family protein [Salinisphaera sp.]|nr:RidA family protein [Salinisphaera sp.]